MQPKAKEELAFYHIATVADTVKTFDGRIWKVKGIVGVHDETGTREHLAELFYQISTIKNTEKRTIAKRKRVSLPLSLK